WDRRHCGLSVEVHPSSLANVARTNCRRANCVLFESIATLAASTSLDSSAPSRKMGFNSLASLNTPSRASRKRSSSQLMSNQYSSNDNYHFVIAAWRADQPSRFSAWRLFVSPDGPKPHNNL